MWICSRNQADLQVSSIKNVAKIPLQCLVLTESNHFYGISLEFPTNLAYFAYVQELFRLSNNSILPNTFARADTINLLFYV